MLGMHTFKIFFIHFFNREKLKYHVINLINQLTLNHINISCMIMSCTHLLRKIT